MKDHFQTETTFEQTWRWYGPADPVPLRAARQAGATGIVTALHHVPNGQVWTVEEIKARQAEIAQAGMRWSVVESVPVHEDIKRRTGAYQTYIGHYQQCLRHLAACGITTVCYNFMPILDWTRTDLAYEISTGARALRFDQVQMAAFDLLILRRPGAEADYAPEVVEKAHQWHGQAAPAAQQQLVRNVLAGLPGAEAGYTLDEFRELLATYREVDASALQDNLDEFLRAVVPVAEEVGIRLAIHPDDPPFPLLGLPRVVSTEDDALRLLRAAPSPANGLCFCTGSYGVRPDNDLVGMAQRLGPHIHFVHLRSTRRQADGSFHEAEHLDGDVDMFGVVRALGREMQQRAATGRADVRLPMRPDHGHQMLDDLEKVTNPGYSAIGRLRGLAELRGLERGIRQSELATEAPLASTEKTVPNA